MEVEKSFRAREFVAAQVLKDLVDYGLCSLQEAEDALLQKKTLVLKVI